MLEYFIAQADDERAKEIMQEAHTKIINFLEDLKNILKNEGAVVSCRIHRKGCQSWRA